MRETITILAPYIPTIFNSSITERQFFADMEPCYCYAAVDESWAGQVFSIMLSCGLNSSILFKSRRKDCQPSTYRLPQRVSPVSRCSVSIQTISLNVNRCIESVFRYYWCDRQWQDCAIILDLTVAFNIVDHDILLRWLEVTDGVNGAILDKSVFVLWDGSIDVSSVVRNLGTFFDVTMSMNDHFDRLFLWSYYYLHRIKSIRHALPTMTAIQLVNSFIILRVDYCNSILAGIPKYQLDWLQSILHVAVRVIFVTAILNISHHF